MLHKLVESKVCSICRVEKLSSCFASDISRHDALRHCCTDCQKTYVSNRFKTSFDMVTKTCLSCSRTLSARMFSYSQTNEDKLCNKCRTCLQYKSKVTSVEDVEHFEYLMNGIYVTIVDKMSVQYGCDDKTVITKHRYEFEQMVSKAMCSEGLLVKWKTPIWLHSKSLPS